ncbi:MULTISPECIES: magnesium/cobalt transporter CorA [Flammeovirga]|uniref:Magnesium transport protein CorA n=1 Tax=Flammeovirga agarivorans TaxID=2726742 RepID=A0A7X8XXU0_9BACT|nr:MULTISPECIES: magnesium/cobalt transporter CorA [Flammeovirga]NLR93557.1 magnesium/cobalt transporter CorA [Flammeovirga agarivorans]
MTQQENTKKYISPDELVYIGKHRNTEVDVHLMDFGPDHFEEFSINNISEARGYLEKKSLTWITFNGLHDVDLVEQLKNNRINSHILSDILDTSLRPTFQEYENAFFISLKMFDYDKEKKTISTDHFSLVIHKNAILSFTEKPTTIFDPLIEIIKKGKKRIVENSMDYLVFRILDIVVDHYILLLRELGDDIDAFEEILLTEQNMEILDQIITYKKLVNRIRRNIKPALETITMLTKYDVEYINDSSSVYFNELLNDLKQSNEIADGYREILSDQLNIYHTTISSKLNSVMMTLTIFSVIFIPLTFIAGIYGTNFENIPELRFKYSYYFMWVFMIIITLFMLNYFRKKKWIKW